MKRIAEDIIVAGFGGQGIMLLGKIIAQAGMLAGLNVTWIPKYGAEVRGGTAHCMVKVSSEEIASPLVAEPTCIIVMNKPSVLKFEPIVQAKGAVVVNESLCDYRLKRSDVSVSYVAANDIAERIGDVKGANMVVLGALLKMRPFIEPGLVVEALKDILPAYRHKYIPLNEKALQAGYAMK